jgi:hypothetical protein
MIALGVKHNLGVWQVESLPATDYAQDIDFDTLMAAEDREGYTGVA